MLASWRALSSDMKTYYMKSSSWQQISVRLQKRRTHGTIVSRIPWHRKSDARLFALPNSEAAGLSTAPTKTKIHGQQLTEEILRIDSGPKSNSKETATDPGSDKIVSGRGKAPEQETSEEIRFDSIEFAIEEIGAGRFVVVLDDEHRENEGDLVAAAELVTTESIAFMVEHTSGVICVGMEGADLDRLELPLMVPASENTDAKCTAFTVTVDLRDGTTTGISASDRARTLRALANRNTVPSNFRRPGHIFPLRCEKGGVLKRRGHTEASVDLSRLAGCSPAGVLCEVVNRTDGSMARTPQLFEFAKQHGLAIVTIEDLVQYRMRQDGRLPSID